MFICTYAHVHMYTDTCRKVLDAVQVRKIYLVRLMSDLFGLSRFPSDVT